MTGDSENLVFVIHRTHDMIKSCEDKVFGEQGLTTEQYRVLTAIKHLNAPVRVTDVARRLTRSVNSISMLVDRMVKVGLVTRWRDGGDRREVQLVITIKGEALLEPAALADDKFVHKILSQVAHEDKQYLIDLLELIQHEASEYLEA